MNNVIEFGIEIPIIWLCRISNVSIVAILRFYFETKLVDQYEFTLKINILSVVEDLI